MSREIDERIVAMHFDNEQFERGARESLKTLDELRQGLDLEGAADSFAKVSKVTSKQLGLKPTTRQVGLFSNSLQSMGRVAKSVFNTATFPLQAISDGLGTLGKYTSTVLGFNIADKLVNTGEQIIRAFTIDPIKTGWEEYELKMDSIKTIMSGTTKEFKDAMGSSYTEDAHLSAIKAALEQLNKYADDTIYSFKDMTSNIGKFVNNGVKLNDAVSAMKGISNAAALAGQGTQQASMAMYNLSQAISVGKLTNIDWKSIENANMATLEMKQTFIDTAAAMGKLQKIGDKYYIKEEDYYKSASKKRKKLTEQQQKEELKAREVTAENFRNMLQYGFADTSVIETTLGIFSGDLQSDMLMKMGFSDKMAAEMEKLGQKAHDAATEVRTFSKMFDALKEAAQSGWAMSLEYIFGDMKEATELWTDLNNTFSDILNKSSETRNNLLIGWRGKTRAKKSDGTDTVIDVPGAEDGRKLLINIFKNILITVQSITASIRKAWTSVFGEMTSERLLKATKSLSVFSGKVKRWFGSMDDANSRVAKISKVLSGVFSVVGMIWNTAKKTFSFVKTIASPIIDFLVNTASTIGGVITEITSGDLITTVKTLIAKFKTLTKEKVAAWFIKVGDSIKTLFGKIKTSATTWMKNNGLGGVMEWIKSTWTTVSTTVSSWWTKISGWEGWPQIGAFFGDIWTWIKEKAVAAGTWVTGAFNQLTSEDTLTAISTWLSNAWNTITTTISKTWNSISTWTGWKEIGKFITNAWTWIKEKAGIAGSWIVGKFNQLTSEDTLTTISTWLSNAWKTITTTISKTWNSISTWTGWKEIGKFITNVWKWILDKLGVKTGDISGKQAKQLPQLGLLIASTGISDVGGGFGKKDQTQAEKAVEETVGFFETIFNPITRLIEAAKGWEGWNTIGEVLTTIFNGISSLVTAIGESTGLDQVLGILNKTSQLILDILDKLIEMGNHLIGKDGTWLQIRDWLFVLAIVGASMYKNKATIARGAVAGESIGATVLKLAAGIYLIALAIGTLGAINDEQFKKGAERAGGIAGALIIAFGLFKVISKYLGETAEATSNTPWYGKLLSNLLKYAGIVAIIMVVMDRIPEIIKSFQGTDIKPSVLMDLFGGLAAFILSLSVSLAVLSKIPLKSMFTGTVGLFVAVMGILATISAIGLALGTTDLITGQGSGLATLKANIKATKVLFEGLGEIFGAMVGAFTGAKDATYMKKAAEGMNEVGEISKDLNKEGFANFQEAMSTLTELQKALPPNPDRLLGFIKFFTGEQKLSDFTAQLPSVAQNLTDFANAFSSEEFPDHGLENLGVAVDILGKLVSAARTLAIINGDDFGIAGFGLASFLDEITNGTDVLSGGEFEKNATDMINIASVWASTFNAGILEAAPEIDATPLIQAIYDSLTSKESKQLISSGFRIMSQYLQDEGLVSADQNGSLNILDMFGKMEMPEGGLFGSMVGKDGKMDAATFLGFDPTTLFSEFKDEKGEISFNNLFGLNAESAFADGSATMQQYIEGLKSSLDENGQYEVNLVPVWDENSFSGFFGSDGALTISGKVSIDSANIASITSAVDRTTTAVNNTTAAVNALSSRINGLEAAIRSMKMVLDTGVIAGAVDSYLGVQIAHGMRE